MPRIRPNKLTRFALDQKILLNLSTYMPEGTTLVVEGAKHTSDDVKAVFKERVDATAVAEAKKEDFHKAVEDERATLAKTAVLVGKIRAALLLMFGATPNAIADLGLTPRKKPKVLTSDEQAAKAKKAKATRQSHHASRPVATTEPTPATPATAIPPTPITPPAHDAPAPVNGGTGSR
jgi:hypothetical protein